MAQVKEQNLLFMKFPLGYEFLCQRGVPYGPRCAYQPIFQNLIKRCEETPPKLSFEQSVIVESVFHPHLDDTMRSKRVIVVGGTAGTGKSTIIREMKRIGGSLVTLLTSNNHQAASLGGFTCHSAFGCTPTKIASDPQRFKKLENQKVVIIDESQQIPQVS